VIALRHVKRWISGVVLAVAAASLPVTDGIAGDKPSKSVQDDARDRLRTGVQAYKDGRYKEAIDNFLIANRLVPSPSLSFNIAKAYEKLGDEPAALMWYRDYLRQAPSAPDRAEVDKRILALQGKLRDKGVQQVTVLSIPAGATVVLDGQPVGVTPWTGEIMPRKHTVTLSRTGYRDSTREFELPPDRAIDVAIALEDNGSPVVAPTAPTASVSAAPVASAPPAQSALPPPASPKIAATTWITLGAGGALLLGSLGFELARRSAESDARDAATQVDARDKYDTMQSRQTLSRVLVGVGAAATIVGGVLLVFDLQSKGPSEPSRGGSSRQVGVGCAGYGCGLVAAGSF
jgi:hypothetical protein